MVSCKPNEGRVPGEYMLSNSAYRINKMKTWNQSLDLAIRMSLMSFLSAVSVEEKGKIVMRMSS